MDCERLTRGASPALLQTDVRTYNLSILINVDDVFIAHDLFLTHH